VVAVADTTVIAMVVATVIVVLAKVNDCIVIMVVAAVVVSRLEVATKAGVISGTVTVGAGSSGVIDVIGLIAVVVISHLLLLHCQVALDWIVFMAFSGSCALWLSGLALVASDGLGRAVVRDV
jgi:hypothetical protein